MADMKRSRSITLTLLTGASLIVTGCKDDKPDEAQFFRNRFECTQAMHDPQLCEDAERQALEQHIERTPKFNSAAECAKEFGEDNCTMRITPPQGGGDYFGSTGYFMPVMLGYMMGRLSSDSWFSSPRFGSQPLCRDAQGTAYAGGCGSGRAGVIPAGQFTQNRFYPSTEFKSRWSTPQIRSKILGTPSVVIRRAGFGSMGRSRGFYIGG